MSAINFKNSPLVEVVFEIIFKEQNPKYDIFVGELYSKLKNKYPVIELVTPPEISAVVPYVVQHRFRTEAEKYPLYQTGPGVVSFNTDGGSYENGWAGYKKELKSFLKIYRTVLGEQFSSDKFKKVSLRYIDKIEDPRMYPDIKKYFDENLKLEINLKFIENIKFNNLEGTSLSQAYQVDERNKLRYKIQTIKEGSRKLLVDSNVNTENFDSIEDLNKWLDNAHSLLKKFFLELTSNIQNLFQ